jgi:hypothetical protein
VSEGRPSKPIDSFNRTLFKNFAQARGVLVLTEEDLRRMVTIAGHGRHPSDYLRERWSEFLRSV